MEFTFYLYLAYLERVLTMNALVPMSIAFAAGFLLRPLLMRLGQRLLAKLLEPKDEA